MYVLSNVINYWNWKRSRMTYAMQSMIPKKNISYEVLATDEYQKGQNSCLVLI